MYGYIYKTTCLSNKKIYIGQRKGLFEPKYYGSGVLIKRALNKYGQKNFKLEIVTYGLSSDQLNKLEQKYISEYRKILGKNKLYNIAEGGVFCRYWLGKHRPLEEKLRISKTLKGRKQYMMTKMIRRKISQTLKGHIPWNKGLHPDYMQGKNHPMYGTHRKAWNKGMKNQYHAKGAGFKKGYTPWNKGKHIIVSKVTRRNLSKAIKSWWNKRKQQQLKGRLTCRRLHLQAKIQ